MPFDPKRFLLEPSQELFFKLKKDDLISLGECCNITVTSSMKKSEIQSVLLKALVESKKFDESVLHLSSTAQTLSDSAVELELRRIEFEREKLRIAAEEREKEREREREREEKEEREKEREREREREREQFELEMKRLELQPMRSSQQSFDVSRVIRLVPPFQEKEVDKYFLHFEKIAESLKWPKEFWTTLLQSVLIGKARDIFAELSIEQSSDYNIVKDLILKAYELVPEAYRQKFRNTQKGSSQTYVEFARTKEQLFDRWCFSKKINSDYDKLKQMILLEEFKRCIPNSIKTFLNEQKVESLEDAARIADDYSLTHKFSFSSKSSASGQIKNDHLQSSFSEDKKAKPDSQSSKYDAAKTVGNSKFCTYCRKSGHVISECFKLKRKDDHKPVGFVSKQFDVSSVIERDTPVFDVQVKEDSVQACFESIPVKDDSLEPYTCEGSVSLSSDFSSSTPITVLRDTGASQSLILSGVLPFSESSFSGNSVIIQGVRHDSGVDVVPLHNVYLTSKYASGPVTLGVISHVPHKGIHLLLGNDLTNDTIVVNPILSDKPCLDQMPDPVEEDFPDLYPACAVTRAMRQKAEAEKSVMSSIFSKDIHCHDNLTDTLVGQVSNDSNVISKDSTNMSNVHKNISSDVDLTDTFLSQVFDNVQEFSIDQSKTSDEHVKNDLPNHKSQLMDDQRKDPELSSLFERTVDEKDVPSEQVCFYLKNGILMRKWRPPDASIDDEWLVKHQIVVPTTYRTEILSLAHDTSLSGHLGVNKTYQKILNHFFWPKLHKDVVQYCRSCHTCQVVGKPNQTIPKAPLKPIPVFGEPFSRIMIDCVGPLPKTRSGNQYLLTMMCTSSRFPEAIPLRNIKTSSIVKALIKFFTLFGLPKSIQSDQGSNFMSGVFQQVMHELGIQQFKSSAYHPESQGALERFHQTLKTMIRSYCHENEKDWDEGVPMLLFAVRESVQESLGFSPFDLVFGHTVRGPLKLLKEKLLSDEAEQEHLHVLQYVSKFRTKLFNACECASANLKTAQNKMKSIFDQNTVERHFEVGQKVLALLPIPGNPLQARYFGPYSVKKKVSDLNYIVETPDRRKQTQLCHVNMLKPYVDRNSTNIVHPISVVSSDPDTLNVDDCKDLDSVLGTTKLENSDVLANLDAKCSHLTESQQQNIKDLIHKYEHLFPDVPSRTDVIFHDVDVGDAKPVKQHPYRMNPEKLCYLQKEVQYLLDNDFIEPSKSAWSSPCILVPKSNNTFRMCTDFRAVNSRSKTDTFPIPRVDDCIDKIGHAKFVTKFDLLKGFWQIPLTEKAKEISAFTTPFGLYQYKVMPFGMKNSPATFQRLINQVICGLDGCAAYIDDITLYSDTWEEHLQLVEEFFRRLSAASLTINLTKSEFASATVTYLGHVVGQGQVKPIDAKISAISEFPCPNDRKQLMRFLGMAGYYRKFCPNFSTITELLTRLLQKKVKFMWTEDCQKSFDCLKAMLKSAPVLSAPDFNLPFKLAIDASDVAAGAVLLQEDKDGIDHPVCYFSKKFNKSQKNYSTVEKECLSLVLALQHFEIYVTSGGRTITVFSDHNPLVFLNKMKNKNQRLLRWSLLLQEYNLNIRHIKGKDNIIADCLSRM